MLITIFDDYTEVKNRMGLSIKNIQQMVNTQPSFHPNLNPRPTHNRLTGIFYLKFGTQIIRLEPQCSQIVLSSRF